MIKAIGRNDDTGKPVFVFGLSRRNMTRLLSGEPILIAGKDMDHPEIDHFLIMGGEDETAMELALRDVGFVGDDTSIRTHSNAIDRP